MASCLSGMGCTAQEEVSSVWPIVVTLRELHTAVERLRAIFSMAPSVHFRDSLLPMRGLSAYVWSRVVEEMAVDAYMAHAEVVTSFFESRQRYDTADGILWRDVSG